jgi:hypothetical protein
MKRTILNILFLPAILLTTHSASAGQGQGQDWADSANPTVVRAAPNSSTPQPQNPPALTWAQYPSNAEGYRLEIRSEGKVVNTFTVPSNWCLPTQKFEPGSYTWRVTPVSRSDWTKERPFVVNAASQGFEVPDNAHLHQVILGHPRPRMLPAGVAPLASWSDAMKRDRLPFLSKVMKEVDLVTLAETPLKDTDWPLRMAPKIDADYAKQMADIRFRVFRAEKQLEEAALLYRITGEKRFLKEALNIGDQMSLLDPEGPTSYVNQIQGTRSIALALVKGVDLLGADLDEERRKTWLNIVNVRGNQIYRDLISNNIKIDQYPLDSQGGQSLSYLAGIATLALGDVPAATGWFDFAFRDYASWVMAWSGPEGGFANGTAYAQYSAYFALRIWQPMQYATGVNLFAKPWTIGFSNFLIDFVPPGSKTHLFGDGHEVVPDFKDLKAFVSRISTPQAAWYVSAISTDEDALALLEAEYPLPAARMTTKAAPAHAAWFSSIGWVAMHSDLNDSQHTSLYFKASPFGAFSHGQADQNSFVLTKANVPLLIETGWYDWYGSPLFTSWYHQTKAHNAITIDRGIGEVTDGYDETLTANAKVTAFSTTADVDYVAGDATPAYGGKLSKAQRRIWYLHQADAVVIEDRLAASAPHVFEWNFHSVNPMQADKSGNVKISNAGQSVCLKPLLADGIHFEKRTGPEPKQGATEDHGAYLSNTSVTSQRFLTLLDVGCKNVAAHLSDDGKSLLVGGETINLTE